MEKEGDNIVSKIPLYLERKRSKKIEFFESLTKTIDVKSYIYRRLHFLIQRIKQYFENDIHITRTDYIESNEKIYYI